MFRPFYFGNRGRFSREKGTVPFSLFEKNEKGELQNLANKVELNNW